MSNEKTKKFMVEVGDAIAVGLKEPLGDSCAFVGWVNRVNDFGVGIELVDWFIGQPNGSVRIIPWELVFTIITVDGVNEYGEEQFWKVTAPAFQTQHNEYINKKLGVDTERNKEIRADYHESYIDSKR